MIQRKSRPHLPRTLWPCLVLMLWCATGIAGEFNEVLSIGDAAPAWKDLPGTDGKSHSLSDLNDKAIVVVVITSASCDTAADYEQRIGELASTYAEKSVAVVPICVNHTKVDRLDALTKRVEQKQLGFHYLYDESQQIAKDFGAIFTPEFYVLNRDRQVVYMGAMDDATDADKVKEKWVEQAITATLAGETPARAETPARGCLVRWARERRKPK